jgi:hypothetical protein
MRTDSIFGEMDNRRAGLTVARGAKSARMHQT